MSSVIDERAALGDPLEVKRSWPEFEQYCKKENILFRQDDIGIILGWTRFLELREKPRNYESDALVSAEGLDERRAHQPEAAPRNAEQECPQNGRFLRLAPVGKGRLGLLTTEEILTLHPARQDGRDAAGDAVSTLKKREEVSMKLVHSWPGYVLGKVVEGQHVHFDVSTAYLELTGKQLKHRRYDRLGKKLRAQITRVRWNEQEKKYEAWPL